MSGRMHWSPEALAAFEARRKEWEAKGQVGVRTHLIHDEPEPGSNKPASNLQRLARELRAKHKPKPLTIAQMATQKLVMQLRLAELPAPELEHRFNPPRRWRFDLAWPQLRLAVEIEGGIHGGRGRHIRPEGFKADVEKYNEAAIMGWRVIRVTHGMIRSGAALRVIERVVRGPEEAVRVAVGQEAMA